MYRVYILLIFLITISGQLQAQKIINANPASSGMNRAHLALLDTVIEKAIEKGDIPGAAILILRKNAVVYRKAFGYKQLIPAKQKMDINTIFDLASLTKPIATATSIMILVDRGQLRLLDKVKDFYPDFIPWTDEGTKKDIRIIHLLTHTSGLPPYAPWQKLKDKYGSPAPDSLLRYIAAVKRHHEPGTYFKYSCLNFITLQKIIEKISGQNLNDFANTNIFKPLKMRNTVMKPQDSLAAYCAATELLKDDKLLLGQVHDPLARVMMGCISGNAGLFSTVDDLAVFAVMMLNEGIYNSVRIMSPAAVRKMTSLPYNYEKFGRSLGWDLLSDYSSNQGDLFGSRTYGHTGYTGTSMIIDPDSRTSVIFLTNRVHPKDKGSVVRLRSLVANIVAASIIK